MTALCIAQPWATCIFEHGKNVENRKASLKKRGTIAIYASATVKEERRKSNSFEETHSCETSKGCNYFLEFGRSNSGTMFAPSFKRATEVLQIISVSPHTSKQILFSFRSANLQIFGLQGIKFLQLHQCVWKPLCHLDFMSPQKHSSK